MGSEPVYRGDRPVGYVTSAAYGYTLGRGIAYAWLEPELAEVGSKHYIEYFGERLPATVAAEPLFDPEMKRMRAASAPPPWQEKAAVAR
jgi:dimethylglycine oxidase